MFRIWNICNSTLELFSYILGRILKIPFCNYVSSLLSTHFTSFHFYRSSRFSQKPEPLICFNQKLNSISTSKFQLCLATKNNILLWFSISFTSYLLTSAFSLTQLWFEDRRKQYKLNSLVLTFQRSCLVFSRKVSKNKYF